MNAYIRAIEGEVRKQEAAKRDRAAFLLWLALEGSRAAPSEPDDTLNDIAADNEAARDDEFNTWEGEA